MQQEFVQVCVNCTKLSNHITTLSCGIKLFIHTCHPWPVFSNHFFNNKTKTVEINPMTFKLSDGLRTELIGQMAEDQ